MNDAISGAIPITARYRLSRSIGSENDADRKTATADFRNPPESFPWPVQDSLRVPYI